MSYIKAADVLPQELIYSIQKYVDGETIYVPRKEQNRKPWGERTDSKQTLLARNREIYKRYLEGETAASLSESYYLSLKSIQKIIAKMRRENRTR